MKEKSIFVFTAIIWIISLGVLVQSLRGECLSYPGDANASGNYTLADVIATVNYIFNKPGCSPQPQCWLSGLLCRGDWNGSGTVTLADVIQGVNYIFNKPGGPWFAKPSGECCLNRNPLCSTMSANPNPIGLGQSTTLTCQASDPDGDQLTYSWTVDSGTISGSGSSVIWTADGVCCPGLWTVTVTVNDGKGGSAVDSVVVGVI